MHTNAKRVSIALIVAAISGGVAIGHPGGLDANGGHHDRKAGTYHFHRAAAASHPTASSQALGLLAADERTALDAAALVSLLIRKGVITRAELDAEAIKLRDR